MGTILTRNPIFDDVKVEKIDKEKLRGMRNWQKKKSPAQERIDGLLATLNEKQREVFNEVIKMEDNFFITSSGGCGKTYLLNCIVDYLRTIKRKNVLVTASTGTAAQLVEGVTVHKAFGFDIGVQFNKNGKHKVKCPKLIWNSDVIIVEEVSMCRLDIIDGIYLSIEKANAKREKLGMDPITVLFFGDLLQLPPVIVDMEKIQLDDCYGRDIEKGYCFQADYWKEFYFRYAVLKEIVRQSDKEDADILNKIRMGDESQYMKVNNKVSYVPYDNAVWVYPFNNQVKSKNLEELEKLRGEEFHFKALTDSEDLTLDEIEKLSHNSELVIKSGARVRITCNQVKNANFIGLNAWEDYEDLFSNGTVGTVWLVHKDTGKPGDYDFIVVKIEKEDALIEFRRKEYEIYDYKILDNGKLHKFVKCSYWQFPLALNYAQSIHSTQGQTFEYMNLNPRNMFCPSQLYVGLSRCKSLGNIHLEDFLRPEDIIIDDKILDFYNNTIEKNSI